MCPVTYTWLNIPQPKADFVTTSLQQALEAWINNVSNPTPQTKQHSMGNPWGVALRIFEITEDIFSYSSVCGGSMIRNLLRKPLEKWATDPVNNSGGEVPGNLMMLSPFLSINSGMFLIFQAGICLLRLASRNYPQQTRGSLACLSPL